MNTMISHITFVEALQVLEDHTRHLVESIGIVFNFNLIIQEDISNSFVIEFFMKKSYKN